jgi:hypothetical protein
MGMGGVVLGGGPPAALGTLGSNMGAAGGGGGRLKCLRPEPYQGDDQESGWTRGDVAAQVFSICRLLCDADDHDVRAPDDHDEYDAGDDAWGFA